MRDEFKITRNGKQYVLYAGLLDEAHDRGLVSIDTELVQVPEEANGNVAIVKAVVEMADSSSGEVKRFSGIGDAAPNNVSGAMAKSLIRMGETRAKARALRDAVNVDATSLEELDESEGGASTGSSPNRSARGSASGSARGSGGSGNSRGQMRAVQGGQGARSGRSGSPEPPPPEDGDGGYGGAEIAGGRNGRAPKSQIDFIKTLAEEWRGAQGVVRLEQRIGKPLSELSRSEAESWIDRLTPKDAQDESEPASGESQGG